MSRTTEQEFAAAEAEALRLLPRYERADGTASPDSLAYTATQQAFSAARSRGYLTAPPVAPQLRPGDVDVTSFADKLVVRTLWPPRETHPTCRLVLALLPADAAPGLTEELGLTEYDLFKDGDTQILSLILGECLPGRSGRYWPEDAYPAAEVVRLTKLFSAPQRAEEARQHIAAARLQEQKRDAERRQQALCDNAVVVSLAQRLAALEAATKPT